MCGSAIDADIECPVARPMPAGAAGQAIALADHDALARYESEERQFSKPKECVAINYELSTFK
jgi:hypothetical protein